MCRSHTAVGWEGALGALRQLGGSKSHGDLEAGAAPLGLPDCLPLPRGSGVCSARTLGANRIALPARVGQGLEERHSLSAVSS